MVEQLFGSKTRVKLLQLFYGNPNRSFYVREITRKIDEQINSVRRELANLMSVGIITSDNSNNKLYYEVNQKYEYYQPLLTIFGGTAVAPVSDASATDSSSKVDSPAVAPQTFKPLPGADIVLLTGVLTRDDRSGIDVLLVGSMSSNQAAKYITELEAQESKELRYAVMTTDEFTYRQKIKDRFLSLVLESKSQVLLDREYHITQKPKPVKPKPTKEKE